MPESIFAILESPRISPQTRNVLEQRLTPTPYEPRFFSREDLRFLTMLAAAVLPQDVCGTHVPFAALIDQRLSAGEGSGWRYSALPPDQETYRMALKLLRRELEVFDGAADSAAILQILNRVQAKSLDTQTLRLSLWLESFKVELIRNWLASPEAMDLIGYDGFADELLDPQPALRDTQPAGLEGAR